jgi:V/A-type H+-transporting ATPase subunit F
MKETIYQYNEQRLPAIIPIPGMKGSMGIGLRNIKKAVEKAVGADILFNED